MKPEELMIRHGEKALVAVIGIACLWWVYSTITDETAIADYTPAEVDGMFEDIERAKNNPGKPNLMPATPFPALIENRFSVTTETSPVLQLVHEHPSIGNNEVVQDRELYAYEVLAPTITAEGDVGRIVLTVGLPESRFETMWSTDEEPVSDSPNAAVWTRQVPGTSGRVEVVENRAAPLAVVVEFQVGGGEAPWKPVKAREVADGVLGVDDLTGGRTAELTIEEGIRPWQAYRFRARLLVDATGVRPGAGVELGNEVVVIAGRLSADAADELPVAAWTAALERGEAVAGMAEPLAAGAVPRSVRRAAEATIYGGPIALANDGAATVSRPDVRIALEGIDFNGSDVKLLVSKMLRSQVDGSLLGWSTPPTEITLAAGQPVAGEISYRNELGEFTESFSTPFVVGEVQREQERELYYVLKAESGDDGERRLVVDSRTTTVDVVYLDVSGDSNAVGVQPLTLVQLRRVMIPQRFADAPYFPGYLVAGSRVNEEDLFADSEADFDPPMRLRLPPPTRYDDYRRLQEVLVAQGLDAQASVINQIAGLPYYEMPRGDGRIFYYNRQTREIVLAYAPPAVETMVDDPMDGGDGDAPVDGEAMDDGDPEAGAAGQ